MAAQTRLAQSVKLRSEFYDVYLLELLSLFADKGTAIQTAKTTGSNTSQVTRHHIYDMKFKLIFL